MIQWIIHSHRNAYYHGTYDMVVVDTKTPCRHHALIRAISSARLRTVHRVRCTRTRTVHQGQTI